MSNVTKKIVFTPLVTLKAFFFKYSVGLQGGSSGVQGVRYCLKNQLLFIENTLSFL
jgi:hypothetical protein